MTSLEHAQPSPQARVIVTRGAKGWELKEELDNRVVRATTYTDWHRVERAVRAFELRADAPSSDHSTNR
jgi:hypothetical protein